MSDLKAWRNSQEPKVSQATLADRLSTTQSHVSEIENDEDKVTLELAAKIFSVTGLRIGRLKEATDQDADAVLRVTGAAA